MCKMYSSSACYKGFFFFSPASLIIYSMYLLELQEAGAPIQNVPVWLQKRGQVVNLRQS